MLERSLYLSAVWFALSLFALVIAGTRVRRGNVALSLAWLLAVIVAGDLIALLIFRAFLETALLSPLALLLGLLWIVWLPDWNAPGQVSWTMMLLSTGIFILFTLLLTALSPLNALSFIFALIFFVLEVINLLLALAHAHESLDVMCRLRWHRLAKQLVPLPGPAPMVSLHVPAYNEPLEVVTQTLQSLAQLDYPDYEVLIIDNNTPREEAWRPLEAVSRALGPRFHCLHVDQWPGYKSGALNFALSQTDPRAELVGIIDADYQVQPDFLRELVPAFADTELAFVQTPQDYRDVQKDRFSRAVYRGYQYFFDVSMPCRNERNAIIVAGTMGLIRKSVLEEIGGWDEWCITEDAEASLRILKRGYRSLYIEKSFGRGLIPFDFAGLKKQRFRWCFGGMQILKKHWEALMPWARWVDPSNQLTPAQRYYYLLGGLGWLTDLFNLLFAFLLILGAAFGLLSSSVQVRPLTTTILIVPAVFLLLHLLRFLWVLRTRLRISFGLAVATMYNFFSLGWAVTLACIQGLTQREGTFLRTPKSRSTSRFWHALQVTQWELAIGLLCIVAGLAALLTNENWRTFSLCVLLLWQGSLYIAAPVYSLLSVGREERSAARVTDQGRPVLEKSAARWVVALFMVMVAALSLAGLLPPASQLPQYGRFFPTAAAALATAGPTQAPGKVAISPTLAPGKEPRATVSVESTYCFSGPGKPGKRLYPLFKGQTFEILGRNDNPGNTWWYIRDPAKDAECWLWGLAATTSGPINNVPILKAGQ